MASLRASSSEIASALIVEVHASQEPTAGAAPRGLAAGIAASHSLESRCVAS